jgi:hypothetical protein
MTDLNEILRKPASRFTRGRRLAAVLTGDDTLEFGAVSLGDLIYDRVNIDGAALQAFDFAHRPNVGDIHGLAVWSHHIIDESSAAHEGHVNRLQGYVFERMAAMSLRQSGAVVEFPVSPNNPGWDFLVNGQPVQAKCGLSAHLVTDHLSKYPQVPRVVVNEDLASHFADNDHIEVIHSITQDAVRSTTERSLNSAAGMLDLHLASVVPAISVVRNAYHLWRGNTDWSGMLENVATDAAGRYSGAGLGKAMGAGAVLVLGLGGWPAILVPMLTATAGYRAGRVLSDQFKREVFLRREHAALSEALCWWSLGAARVLTEMIERADKTRERFAAVRGQAHGDYYQLLDDWLNRLENEQAFRHLHLQRFERGAADPWSFDDGCGSLGACTAAMVNASRAGILPVDLRRERKLLTARFNVYASGLRRRLLRH